MILFTATSRRAVCLTDDPLTVGSVGVEVRFQLAGWDAAPARAAVFVAGRVKVDVALTGSSCTVPPEVLANVGETLVIGLYGTGSGGEIVIPTIYAEAGRILPGAAPSGIEPTPQTQPLIDQLLEAAEGALAIAQGVRDDADAGEFDGADGQDGSNAWTIDAARVREFGSYLQCPISYLVGPSGATPRAGDVIFVSDGRLTQIDRIVGQRADTILIGDLHGPAGYSPEVTITQIEGGHRVTITDEDHPEGQSFDVMDGQGGSGTVDDDFSTTSENPVQNKVITAAFNQAAQQLTNLGLALDDKVDKVSGKSLSSNDFTDSDKDKLDGAASETWVQQQGYITGADLALYRTAAQQDTIDDAQDTAIAAIKGVHWCTYGTTTDVEIQAAIDAGKLPAVNHNNTVFLFHSWDSNSGYTFSSSYIGGSERVACKNGVWSTGDLKFPAAATSAPSDLGTAARGTSDKYARQDHVHKMPSAADVGAVAVAQGVDHAGEFVVVGSDGNITTVTMSVWQGGSY